MINVYAISNFQWLVLEWGYILHVYVVTTLWMRLVADLILQRQASVNNWTIKWSSLWPSVSVKGSLPNWLFLIMGNWEGVRLQQACVMCPTPKIPSSRGVTGADIVCGEDCMWHSVVSRCGAGEKQWIFSVVLCCVFIALLLHCKRCTVEFPLGLEARRHMAEPVSCFI